LKNFETLLAGSAKEHGHMCPGQVIGVRMALLGLDLIDLENPKETRDIKKLIVYVEIDRCATDAIAYVTGAALGRRSLKFIDGGIMAATFVNLETGKAFRIVSRESARYLAQTYAPNVAKKREQQLQAYKKMPLYELFRVSEVKVNISQNDMPGPTKFKVLCEECGIMIRDKKEVLQDGLTLCRECAGIAYYYARRDLELIV
jgi:formylmethanofuran dehydrogenase subunit E